MSSRMFMMAPSKLLPFFLPFGLLTFSTQSNAQSSALLVERSNFHRAISEFGGFALVASTCPSGTSPCDERACCPDGTTCHKTSRSSQKYSPHCCSSGSSPPTFSITFPSKLNKRIPRNGLLLNPTERPCLRRLLVAPLQHYKWKRLSLLSRRRTRP
jgi:hypothetical protein